MSKRKKPLAYVTAKWDRDDMIRRNDAIKWCRELSQAGYVPICPVIMVDRIMGKTAFDELNAYREMADDMINSCRFLVVCGSSFDESVVSDIRRAKGLNLVVTTLDGVLTAAKLPEL